MTTYDVRPEPHSVDASHASAWLGGGWRLFMAAPAVWTGIGVVFVVIHLLCGVLPLIGGIAYMLLLPVLAAGLMEASRIAASGAPLPFDTVFAGFRSRTGDLIMVGLWAMGGMAIIGTIVFSIVLIGGGSGTVSALEHMANTGADAVTSGTSIGLAIGSLLFAALLAFALMLPLGMALWFAPALVFFDGMAPLAAMKSSYIACAQNWIAITVFGLLLFVLGTIAAVTVVGLLLLVPIMSAAIYLSYRDIYHYP